MLWLRRRAGVTLSCFQMIENFSNDFVLGDKGDDTEGTAAVTFQGVDLIGDRFILHLLQRVWSKSGYLRIDAVSYCDPLELVGRSRAGQRATDLGRCTCERG